jgi:CO/xanthine dehydrogenase Mo-binding subunit
MTRNEFRVAGQRLPRIDGIGKVIGKHVYAADFGLPGMLFGRVLRSQSPHARIKRIEVAPALAIPGVRAVITAKDIPATRYGQAIKDMTVLATERVLFAGHAIAAVAADTLEAAEAAVAAIVVELEELPAILDPERALADSMLIHPDWASFKAVPYISREGNITGRSRMTSGDVEAAFRQAYRVYEHRFSTALVHPGYTEPRAAVADWDANGNLTVWSNTQLPFDMQVTLSEILDLPTTRVRVLVPGIGGGFGGKLRIGTEHYAALLARKTGRPVRVICTSEDELTAANPRQPTVTILKTGVDKDGRILARQGRILVDCGAYSGSGPGTAAIALQVLVGPYRTPNLLLEGLSVYTNACAIGADGKLRDRKPNGHHRRRPGY